MRMEYFIFGFVLILAGMISGAVLAHSYLAAKYKDMAQEEIEKEQLRALHAIREGYRKNEARTKLLLEELGEVLDVDVVELPSFGYVLLKGAGEVAEGFLEDRGDDFEETQNA